ncbi:MAG: 30S ribosomal protein S4e [Candidatus Heimdallarchaeota archaeon]|nr:MAG: 30S ribosomal protein S4e [Candidatus Heimdallarchaeota archaeon]
MGKKGSPRHRKRLSAPIAYPIPRKHGTFTIKPYPTRSSMESSIPLGIVIREMLGYAKTLSEVKKILSRQMIKVDGKVQTNYKSSLGPMDILEIPKTDEYFRLTPYRGKRRFKLHPIPKEDTHLKIQRIQKKQMVKKSLIQLTFHDGRNFLLNPEEEYQFPISEIAVKDSVMFNLEDKTIEDHYPFTEGNTALIMGGHNVGIIGKIREIESQSGRKTRTVTLETEKGEIKTTDHHLFVIGREEPVIEIPQETGTEEDEL